MKNIDMYLNGSHFRNHSAFSKKTADNHIKSCDMRRLNLKLSNSKTTFEAFPTERSESQTNQINNNLAFSQDIQSQNIGQFHIKTFIRFRPQKFVNKPYDPQQGINKKVAIIDKKKILCEDNFFAYDHVFEPISRQEEIYNSVCKQMVEHFVRGFNSTVFAYGQTGSGKTYTMFGEINDQIKKGIIPSAIKDIFLAAKQISLQSNERSNAEAVVSCSMLQIYKETMIDLLSNQKADLKIKENQFINVSNLTIKPVFNEEEMYEVLKIGNQSKKIRQTHMNQASSRSHVIFTIYLEVRRDNQKRLSKFNLVDLAGSQKVSKSKVQGQGLEQAKKINLSLSCLGNTINALLKKNDHVPYRQSKLTRLLYESLGGNSLTRLIVTCSSEDSEIEQTLSSLKFASRAKNLKTNPLINTLRKSQKSVSRIAYENLKTNLNKAENKIKKIKIFLDELKEANKSHKKGINVKFQQQDKENKSICSNSDISIGKNNEQIQHNLHFENNCYKTCVQKIQALFTVLGKDLLSQWQHNPQRKQNPYAQNLSNPFLLICEENDMDFIFPSQESQKISMGKSNQKVKSTILVRQSLSEQNKSAQYWQVIKQQEKQIHSLKKKIQKIQPLSTESAKNLETYDLIKNQSDFMSKKQCSLLQTRKNSNFLCETKQNEQNYKINTFQVGQKDKKTKKMNIKISGKMLPVRQIFLKSPKNNQFLQSRKVKNSYQKISSTKKESCMHQSYKNSLKYLSNINSKSGLNSPREFMPTQYAEENVLKQKQNEKNIKVETILAQICKKMGHKDDYDRFQRKVLVRQVHLLLQQVVKCEKWYNQKDEDKNKSLNLQNQHDKNQKKADNKQQSSYRQLFLSLQQTNQQIKIHQGYIQQLQQLLEESLIKKQSLSGVQNINSILQHRNHNFFLRNQSYKSLKITQTNLDAEQQKQKNEATLNQKVNCRKKSMHLAQNQSNCQKIIRIR